MPVTLTVATADPGRHAWQGVIWGWHGGFAALAALTGGLLLLDAGEPGRRYAALGLLAALAGWYAATAARTLHREPAALGWVYLTGAAALTVGLFAAAPVGALMLFALYPHIWVLLPTRSAAAATAVVATLVTALTLIHFGWSSDRLLAVVGLSAAVLLVGLGLGLWITRIIAQSARRAELIAELAATRAELAELSREAGVLAERDRLAQEIHDTVAQGLTSILLLLEAGDAALGPDQSAARRYLDRARRTARDNLTETRSVVAALAPPSLRAPLPDAIRQLADRVGPDLGTAPLVTVAGSPRPLPPGHELTLLRVVQEALANVRRHAAATGVEISLTYDDAAVRVEVADDGRGFDPAAPSDGYGLPGMRRRVAGVGGTVTVDSTVGGGTRVRVELGS